MRAIFRFIERKFSMKKRNPGECRQIIQPTRGWSTIDLREVWRYRELLYFFVWRDIKVRYKQTFMGAAWAIIQPFLTMIVFTLFFRKIAKMPSEGIPYPIFSYSGLLIWIYFSTTLSNISNSLINNAHLITRVYFPRIIIPLSAAVTGVVDYAIAFVILVVMMFVYGIFPNLSLLVLPLTVLAAFIAAVGLGLWVSALNVKYRDIRYAIPFFIQLLLFATPVIYPTSIIQGRFRWVLLWNPISGIIDAHRACILGYKPIDWYLFGVSVAVSLLIFIGGIFYFHKTERYFADVI